MFENNTFVVKINYSNDGINNEEYSTKVNAADEYCAVAVAMLNVSYSSKYEVMEVISVDVEAVEK
jgi:hypothetical protein